MVAKIDLTSFNPCGFTSKQFIKLGLPGFVPAKNPKIYPIAFFDKDEDRLVKEGFHPCIYVYPPEQNSDDDSKDKQIFMISTFTENGKPVSNQKFRSLTEYHDRRGAWVNAQDTHIDSTPAVLEVSEGSTPMQDVRQFRVYCDGVYIAYEPDFSHTMKQNDKTGIDAMFNKLKKFYTHLA